MVDVEILRRRLDTLAGYLDRLERFREVRRETFVDDPSRGTPSRTDLGDLRQFAAVAAGQL